VKTLLEKLERNIADEIAVQKRIQALLDTQLEVLQSDQPRRLPEILLAAEEHMAESRRLEVERDLLRNEIAQQLGRPAHEIRLATLEETIGADDRSLAELGAELKAILARIRERNREVSLMLRHSMLFLEELIRTVTGAASAPPETYDPAGRREPKTGAAIAAEA